MTRRCRCLVGVVLCLATAIPAAENILPPARTESLVIETSAPHNPRVVFAFRLPRGFTPDTARCLVLFGGRNWEARRTLNTYRFDELADRYNLVLLAPGFRDDDYWQPESWSGTALEQAISTLHKQYAVPERLLFYYGYSAGGQCASLFYAWKPERVAAWAAHACGVWFEPEKILKSNVNPAPALVTCGVDDDPRHAASRQFVYHYREAGGEMIWRDYPAGHELTPAALDLARAFFASILESAPDAPPFLVSDDDTGQVYAVASRHAERIPLELRSVFRNQAVAEIWQRQRRRE